MEVRGRHHRIIHLKITSEDSTIALTFMGLRHCSVLNMLDDYLLRCGVANDALQPASYHRQLQEEREARQNEEFLEKLAQITKTGEIKLTS
jgi:hypothetical protein